MSGNGLSLMTPSLSGSIQSVLGVGQTTQAMQSAIGGLNQQGFQLGQDFAMNPLSQMLGALDPMFGGAQQSGGAGQQGPAANGGATYQHGGTGGAGGSCGVGNYAPPPAHCGGAQQQGGPGDDTRIGTSGDDVLHGGAGDDILRGGSNDDGLHGGQGDDVLRGGSGDDLIHDGSGDDFIAGGSGDDTLKSGGGDDLFAGGSGDDTLQVGGNMTEEVQHDKFNGGSGEDTLDLSEYSPEDYTVEYSNDDETSGTVTFNNGSTIEFNSVENLKEKELVTTELDQQGGTYDVSGMDSVDLELDFKGGSAGYDNTMGYYVTDDQGEIIGGGVIDDNVKNGDAGSVNVDLPEGASEVGFFVIPDGGKRAPDLPFGLGEGLSGPEFNDGDQLNFADNGDGTYTISNGSEDYNGQVLFSDSQRNGDNMEHVKWSDNGNQMNWEDLWGGGDQDYDDIKMAVSVSNSQYV